MNKKKIQPIFFDSDDEQQLVDRIRAQYGEVAVVDGVVWPSPEPSLKETTRECDDSIILLWRRGFPNSLPSIPHHSGFQGPQTKVVVRIIRSRMQGGELRSGQIDVSYDTSDASAAEFGQFAKAVFKVASSMNSLKIAQTHDGAKADAYVVGPSAAKFASQGGLLRHLVANIYYRPFEEAVGGGPR